jgi:hypothetical protein
MPEGSAPAANEPSDMPALPADDTPHPVRAAEPAPEPPAAAVAGDGFDLAGDDEPLAEDPPEEQPLAAEPLDEEPLGDEPQAEQAAESEELLGVDTPVPTGLAAADPDPPTQGALRDAALDNPEFLFDGEDPPDPALDSGFELATPGAPDELTAPDPEHDSDAILADADDADHVRAQAFGIEPSGASAPSESFEIATSAPEPEPAEAEIPEPESAETEPEAPEDDPWAMDSGGEEESWASVLDDDDSSEPASGPPAPLAEATEEKPRRERPAGLTELDFGTASQRAAQTALRTAAFAVGLLLVLGGLRVLITHGLGAAPGPQVVRANGWAASEIEAAQLRDAVGDRVLVLRGSLVPEERQAPPEIEVTLIDALGNPLEARVLSHLERVEGAELNAEALSEWLRRGGATRRAARPVSGFTVLVPDPPAAASRFRLELLPGPGAS